jgi:IS30 family transposase
VVKPAGALKMLQGFTDKLPSIVLPLRPSMSYDQGLEMAMHMDLSKRTGIPECICFPCSPWQRGLNENMDGFLPKGTDLSVYSQEELDAIEDDINRCPRKRLGTNTTVCLPCTACKQTATFHTHLMKSRVLHFTFESAPRMHVVAH